MSKVEWKPFSPKALDAMQNSNAFINILEGAVRSSKTLTSIIAWLSFLEESPHDEFLMSGNTTDTLYRNVIGGTYGILSIMGKRRAKYMKAGQGGAQLILRFGNREKICYCVGAYNEKAEERIRGMTVAGWYADEVTLYPESFVKQAINRLSLPGARAFWTCNPDSPYHYIKTEFIDKAEQKGYKHWHFKLDDNWALSEEYKENIKKAYAGVWYQRMVEGLWVLAEGVIYDMFDEDVHVVRELPRMVKRWVAVDYGTASVTVFQLLGLGNDDNLYVIDEWRHDAKEAGRQMTDIELARAFKEWILGWDVIPSSIFVDPSAKSFALQLNRDFRRVVTVEDADNTVNDGIRVVSSLFAARRLFVHERCKGLRQELSTYMWDPNYQKIGKDKPLKENDHSCDTLRYGVYSQRSIWRSILKGVA